MPSEPRWQYLRPRAYAVIGGEAVATVAVTVTYALNSIPRARIALPVGRSVPGGMPAAAHSILAGLVEQTPIEIYLSISPAQASDGGVRGLGMPMGDFKIFEGFTAGCGFLRGGQQASFVIEANGWLVKLNQGSIFSEDSHPANPSQYSFGALQPASGDSGGRHWTVLSQAEKHVTAASLTRDLWGAAIHPWFLELCKRNGFWVKERNVRGSGSNEQAAAAMSRLAPGGSCYTPLALKSSLSVDEDVASQIAKDVALLTFDPESMSHQTIWDVLVAKFCPDYMLALVPRVSTASVVPYVPGFRGGPFGWVYASEYDHAELHQDTPRPLRAFGVQSTLASRTGALGEAPGQAMGIGGWFDAAKDGAVMVGAAPRWMSQVVAGSRHAAAAVGADRKAIRNAVQPGAGQAKGIAAKANQRAKNVIKPLLDSYAQARYAQEVLRGRWGVISGALRVDVAPGSTVAVETAAERFLAGVDALGLPFYGEVAAVTLQVDGESRVAGTSLHLTNCRNAAENQDDRASVGGHPIYAKAYVGCPLVDA